MHDRIGPRSMETYGKHIEDQWKCASLYGRALDNRLFQIFWIRFSVFGHFLLTYNGFLAFGTFFRFKLCFGLMFIMPKHENTKKCAGNTTLS